jgi:hypothetical protein
VLDNEENADNEDADNEENGSTHDWTKVGHKGVRKRRTSLAHADDGKYILTLQTVITQSNDTNDCKT